MNLEPPALSAGHAVTRAGSAMLMDGVAA